MTLRDALTARRLGGDACAATEDAISSAMSPITAVRRGADRGGRGRVSDRLLLLAVLLAQPPQFLALGAGQLAALALAPLGLGLAVPARMESD